MKSLKELARDLDNLECIVGEEYGRLKIEAAAEGLQYIRIPIRVADGFRHHLSAIWAALFGNGPGDLRLVTEEHDELRLRVQLLEHLLERDIPYAYMARVCCEPGRLPQLFEAASPRTREAVAEAPLAGALPWWRGGLVALIDRLRRWLDPSAASQAVAQVPVRRPEPAAAPLIPEYLQRLVLLYRLMQEDEEHLVQPGQALPPLTIHSARLEELLRFVASETGGRFLLDRAEALSVARTPEELSRKLRDRNFAYSSLSAA